MIFSFAASINRYITFVGLLVSFSPSANCMMKGKSFHHHIHIQSLKLFLLSHIRLTVNFQRGKQQELASKKAKAQEAMEEVDIPPSYKKSRGLGDYGKGLHVKELAMKKQAQSRRPSSLQTSQINFVWMGSMKNYLTTVHTI